MGGSEFTESNVLLNRMIQNAAIYNSRLAELGCFEDAIFGSSQRQEVMNPRYTKSFTDGGSATGSSQVGTQNNSQS